MASDPNGGLEALLDYLKMTRGFDFTGYKRTSLERRIAKRMAAVGTETYAAYLDFLEVHPDEFPQLFDTILINVTKFFRDAEAWEYIAQQVIPRIEVARGGVGQIRVWSAGCASGEEAYTIAMLFAEVLGVNEFSHRVKVYATDVDEDALATARHGVYTAKELEDIPEDLRVKYFEEQGSRFAFRKNLRRSVIFGRHDLVQDAPISRLDLLVCRNTLMYFNAELQSRVLRSFHFALADYGVLFLGKAETMLTHGDLFRPLDLKQRVFEKVPLGPVNERARAVNDPDAAPLTRHVIMREAAIDASPVAQILIDVDGTLLVASQQARALFDIASTDIGSPIQDLEISYRPLELRSRLETAYTERHVVHEANVDRARGNGDVQTFDVTIAPVIDTDGTLLGATVSFVDVTRYRRLRQELERSNQELETAYEELQSTNEELETTNEELQSTVEELETTNEELQSSNEELETTNEELQSTNAEIQAMNDDINLRSEELNRIAALTDGILSSLDMAVIVIDRNFEVTSWNDQATEMWGLRSHEVVGRELQRLDIGLPVAQLDEPIAHCLRGERSRASVEATNRRGRHVMLNVTCNPFIDADGRPQGVVILLEEVGGSPS